MDSIKVTPAELVREAKNVDQEATSYYNKYKELIQTVETLTSGDWTGEDADLFREKVKALEPDFAKMKQLMEEYASFLRSAAKNYDNTTENVMSAIRGLR